MFWRYFLLAFPSFGLASFTFTEPGISSVLQMVKLVV